MKTTRKSRLYRQLLTSTLLLGGAFNFVAPVLAQTAPTPTSAGTSISNTATATYTDSTDPGTTLGSSSNTVLITVAEVAGIFVNNAGVVDNTPATAGIQAGDTVFFDFDVTNVGNDPTNFVIPNLATIAGPGTVTGNLEISLNGGTTYTPISGGQFTSGQIQPGASVRVRVPVLVNAGATSGTITVTLGDTTPSSAQNVPYLPSGGSVYTADNNAQTVGNNPIPEANTTAPANGEREASNNQSATINATPRAFAAVLKDLTTYNNNSTQATNDDKLTYGLSLRVDGNPPSGSTFTAAPLTGTPLSPGGVNGNTTAKYILVSDAIPANTDLDAAPTPPAGWTVVYTTSATSVTADEAVWTTTAPAFPAAGVTRVGFIYNPNNNLAAGSPAIATNTTVTGFAFTVRTEAAFTAGGQVANIAQLFGTTQGGGTTIVYDESGDQNPSNYNDNGTPGSNTPTTGVANPTTDGIDPGDNTGTDPAGNTTGGGEDNVINIPAPGASAVLLGPEGTPGATGPTNNNDDFTNRTTPVPAGTDTSGNSDTTNPAPITFINTAQNNSASPANISIIPTTPANLGIADLPTNTVVTISAVGVGTRNYVWTGTAFVVDADGNAATTGDQSPIDTAAEVLTYPNVAVGAQVSYSVLVDLPAGTTLSTDLVSSDPDGEYGYPIPVTAFIDTDTDGVIDTAEVRNTTIDRAYVGFLRLLKESRILQGTGPAVPAGQGTFSTTDKNPAPGNIIEYRITYSNISSAPAVGSNSVGLNANNIVITENGTATPNNWGKDNDAAGTPGFGTIDTLNVPNTAIDSGGAPVAFFSGITGTTSSGDVANVTAYQVNTGLTPVVGPGVSRTFTFQRLVDN